MPPQLGTLPTSSAFPRRSLASSWRFRDGFFSPSPNLWQLQTNKVLMTRGGIQNSHKGGTVKPALVTNLYSETTSIQIPLGHVPIVALPYIFTSIKRPPLFKDHLVLSQLWLYHAFLPLLRDHLYSKTTFLGPSKRGHLILVLLYFLSISPTTFD